jgi:hypothetical protein
MKPHFKHTGCIDESSVGPALIWPPIFRSMLLILCGLLWSMPAALHSQSGFPANGVRIAQTAPATQTVQPKKRLVVLTDIEADPDDSQTLVRLLLYANDIDIEALIATTSTHQKYRVAPETIRKIVNAYGKVQPNLLKHDKEFPSAMALLSIIKQGIAKFGMEGVGEGNDSEGSEFIIRILEKPDTRPVWVTAWGGPNCLAQALWKIQKTRTPEQAEKLYAKLRVYTIGDQDDSGPWMRKTFPSIFYIPSNIYGAIAAAAAGSNTEVVSPAWLAENLQQGHGPLGAQYPDISYGMEGDTPSYLGLIRNGLNEMEHPNWGGWGGRYEFYLPTPEQMSARGGAGAPPPGAQGQAAGGPPAGAGSGRAQPPPGGQPGGAAGRPPREPETRPIWAPVNDAFSPASMMRRRGPDTDSTVFTNPQVTIWRWRTEYQNDFAARMDWTIKPFSEANHPPVAKVNHPEEFTVKSGEYFRLDADGSTDPDGDSLSYFWFQYPEIGTFKERVSFGPFAPNLYNVHTIRAPDVDKPQTVHFILKVTDKGTPPLTRYKRVIVTILPK